MCGIVGNIIRSTSGSASTPRSVAEYMSSRLRHRGPDDSGIWVSNDGRVALAHRRLSIIDTTSGGHQPMTTKNDHLVVVFNGEIYNYKSLRNELSQLNVINWKTNSDTEVLLNAFEKWGIQKTLKKIDGMFALALYDKQENTITLARDRVGEKPLYYKLSDNSLTFGSELKAFQKEHLSINQSALNRFLRYGYIAGSDSIYSQIKKLQAGHFLSFKLNRTESSQSSYWDLTKIAKEGLTNPNSAGYDTIINEFESLVKQSVQARMIADVPIGAFLSGGYDSSLVVSMMQDLSNRPVKTFTIGFSSKEYNEAKHAKTVSRVLGTDHTEAYLTPEQALEEVPKIPGIYCEPFADPSLIPTLIVSRLARCSVKTVLSGDGGDELCWGYNRHIWADNIKRLNNKYPKWILKILSEVLLQLPPNSIVQLHKALSPILPRSLQTPHALDKISKLANAFKSKNAIEFYENATSTQYGSNFPSHDLSLETLFRLERDHGPVAAIALIDMLRYLPEDVLAKVDRASMSAGLEARVPLLSHKLIEYCWRIPSEFKIKNGTGKWILRELVHKRIPRKVMDRPKAGFSVPIGQWLKGPLKPWANDLLSHATISQQNEIDPSRTRKLWIEHQNSNRDHSKELWNILTFLSWNKSQS